MIRLAAETPLILEILDNCSGVARNDFPVVLNTFNSGSTALTQTQGDARYLRYSV